MNKPFFSVIISTYNRAAVLPRAIASVLDQTEKDLELIIIDNGSTDSTPQTLAQIKDPRIIALRNPVSTGSCDGPRNLGIEKARGAYTSFLDDDDLWYPEKLAKTRAAIERHPGIDVVAHYENRRVNGILSGLIRHEAEPDQLFETLLYDTNCLSPCAISLRTPLLRELKGFDLRPEFAAAADYDFWLRMAKRGVSIHFIKEALGEFNQNAENGSVTDGRFDAKIAWLIEYHIRLYEHRRFPRYSARALNRLFVLNLIAARSFFCRRAIGSALRHATKAAACLIFEPLMPNRIPKEKNPCPGMNASPS